MYVYICMRRCLSVYLSVVSVCLWSVSPSVCMFVPSFWLNLWVDFLWARHYIPGNAGYMLLVVRKNCTWGGGGGEGVGNHNHTY